MRTNISHYYHSRSILGKSNCLQYDGIVGVFRKHQEDVGLGKTETPGTIASWIFLQSKAYESPIAFNILSGKSKRVTSIASVVRYYQGGINDYVHVSFEHPPCLFVTHKQRYMKKKGCDYK